MSSEVVELGMGIQWRQQMVAKEGSGIGKTQG